MSEGVSDNGNIRSPFGSFFPSHQTKLYTAVLEVQNAADSTAAAPQPVDLVGSGPAMGANTAPRDDDNPTEASHTQAAALQTEAEPSQPTAGTESTAVLDRNLPKEKCRELLNTVARGSVVHAARGWCLVLHLFRNNTATPPQSDGL